jgi:probable blue pigment (indigoidine) exporter
LAGGGTGLADSNWFSGIAALPVAATSLLVRLSPVVASLAGCVVLGQALTAVQVAGVALGTAAVASPRFHRRRARLLT